MIRQKIIEVRVCDKCGREVGENDFFVCPSCHQDVCYGCGEQHNMSVPDSEYLITTTYYCPEHMPRKKGNVD